MNDHEPQPTGGEVILPRRDYPLLASPDMVAKTLRRIQENLGLTNHPVPQLDVYKLSKIQNPASGDDHFKVDTATGTDRRNTLTGVIVAFRQARAYYKKAYGAGQSKNPPDCSSKDGFTGKGDPGGNCTQCPKAEFNTASQGTGQACREKRELLVMLPGQMLPHLLSVTPTSLAGFTKYSVTLLSSGMDYWEVITRMTLEGSVTSSGMPIHRIRFSLYAALPPEEAARITPFHETMLEWLAPMTVDTTAFEIIDTASQPERTALPQAAPGPSDDVPF